jgi:antitoxin VapB
MAMNIKSAEAHQLAKELAALEHTTVTDAVILSLREAVERRQREEDRTARAQAMKDIAGRFAEIDRERQGPSLTEITEDLYDEVGLPR